MKQGDQAIENKSNVYNEKVLFELTHGFSLKDCGGGGNRTQARFQTSKMNTMRSSSLQFQASCSKLSSKIRQ